MKTIIAGTDFTPSSINACKYAALLAQKLNCKLTIFNMFEAPVIHSNMGLFGISYTSQRKASENKAEKLIKDILKIFPKLTINELITTGSFNYELQNFSKEHQIEAMVMGLAAKDRISKYIYGSHGINIVGKIECPVIIVPEKYTKHKLQNVLMAVDNNEKLAKSTLSGFEKFVKQAKLKINLVHFRTEEELFHPLTFKLTFNSKKLPIEMIKAKDIESGVKRYCSKSNFDLVAIIGRKHSAFYNLFAESNTKKIAFVSKVPVISIHE